MAFLFIYICWLVNIYLGYHVYWVLEKFFLGDFCIYILIIVPFFMAMVFSYIKELEWNEYMEGRISKRDLKRKIWLYYIVPFIFGILINTFLETELFR